MILRLYAGQLQTSRGCGILNCKYIVKQRIGKTERTGKMKILDVMRSRRSVRTFDGNALRPEDTQKIVDYAEKMETPYGIPIIWKLLDAKRDGLSTPVISGTDAFIAGKMQKVPHAEEAFGYAFEKMVLFAQSLGVGTTWIAGTMDRAAFEKAMELADGEDGIMQKCELCLKNASGEPACVKGCPNRAIVYEERGEAI